jgi:hypothetical protein
MFGFFGKKSFEQEMAGFESNAKELGRKYPIGEMLGNFDLSAHRRMLDEMNQLTLKRIDCCKRYGKSSDLLKWQELLSTGQSLS